MDLGFILYSTDWTYFFCFSVLPPLSSGACVTWPPEDLPAAGGQRDRPAYGLLRHAACLRPGGGYVPAPQEGHRRDLAQVLLLPGQHDDLPVLHVRRDPPRRVRRCSR